MSMMNFILNSLNMAFSNNLLVLTPFEQNDGVERKNHSLVLIVRCLFREMNVPKHFWHMTILTSAFLLNRTLSRSLQSKTPLYLLLPDSTPFFYSPSGVLSVPVLFKIVFLLTLNLMIKRFIVSS